MSLKKITQVTGTGVYVPGDDIDTDRIIPARFMKCVTFDGLGPYAFYDERTQPDGSLKQHPFNESPWNKAPILLSGSNFGCGSSREHAPQSLYHWGIRAVIAESFAEIFFGNSTTLGIPCMKASGADIRKIAGLISADPIAVITLDVSNRKIHCKGAEFDAHIADGAHSALVNGRWDAIAELLENNATVDSVAVSLGYA